MREYLEMSDFEINKLVAEAQGVCFYVKNENNENMTACRKYFSNCFSEFDRVTASELKDYCNSWADMGPIIESSAISIWSHPVHGKDTWSARVNKLVNGFVDYQVTQDHDNPLRAAAIIYLESLEASNV
jgi:hypothetical protein